MPSWENVCSSDVTLEVIYKLIENLKFQGKEKNFYVSQSMQNGINYYFKTGMCLYED